MILSIMQPYFFPYLGYFQLLAASDVFVLYDDVQYIKNGWVNRNRILTNGEPSWFTLPVRKDAHDLAINKRHFILSPEISCELLRRIEIVYRRAPNFSQTFSLLTEILEFPDSNVARFNTNSICKIATHLRLRVRTVLSSQLGLKPELKGQERVLAVCAATGAQRYINPLGGVDLYREGAFRDRGVELRFLSPTHIEYPQFDRRSVRNLSIIDALMFNDTEALRGLLNNYELLSASEAVGGDGSANSRKQQTRPWRVLIFPGGTEAGLEINRALRDCKDVELFGAGLRHVGAAEFRFRRYAEAPHVAHPQLIERINAIVAEERIQFVYPAHDDALLALARAGATLGAPLVTSPLITCEITRSKLSTYRQLRDVVAVPRTFIADEVRQFPVFVKPDRGQGSRRARLMRDRETLLDAVRNEPDLIVCEYLPGEEFTIDCFSSSKKGLQFVSARRRVRARDGISMNATLERNPIFESIAQAIASKLTLRGAWFFQMKRDIDGNLRLLEVAPRIAGTMALSRVRGVNFPLLSLYDVAGFDVQIDASDTDIEIGRSLQNHYRLELSYSIVYVDLDDTLVLRGEVNTRLIAFLYQCVNRKIPIHLITRHKENLTRTLEAHRLDSVFDAVHHLPLDVSKASVISAKDAILIDDSFAERHAVAQARAIATFDPTSIECLMDDRG